MPRSTRTRAALSSHLTGHMTCRATGRLTGLVIAVIPLLAACGTDDWSGRASALGGEPMAGTLRGAHGSAFAQDAAVADAPPPDSIKPRGTIVRGPTNITSFSPDDTSVAVDVESVSVRQIFEAIGENGTLWYQHVQTLADPFFEGRVNGSRGTERAREYMEYHFRLHGLTPAFPPDEPEPGGAMSNIWTSFEQPFEFSAGRRMQTTAEDSHADVEGRALIDGEDFVVLGNSGSGNVTGPVTFVGYGIGSGVDGYSSFADDSDLSGRVALLLRYEPLGDDGASRWSDSRFSPNAGIAAKMRAVADRDAEGIILVNPPGARDGAQGLEPIDRSSRFGRQMRIPVIQMSPDAAEMLLASADPAGGDLMAWRRRADAGEVTTADLADDVTVSFGAKVERKRLGQNLDAANVGAVLRGRGSLADEYLVIGGHYDHNGYGQFGTTPESGPLFPGADDNASGTAGILVLAKMLSETYAARGDLEDLRSVLFIAFDAEERGLHGSRHYSRNPTVEPDKMTALLNMDMVGRLRSNELNVLGVGSAHGFDEVLRPHFEASGLTVAVTQAGSGRSDDANFNRVNVPALHFFTGMHPEYTSPRDKAYTVNPVGAAKIIDLMYSISEDLVTRPDKLIHESLPPERSGQDRGYAPVRLGIQPGMGEDLETGILIDAVSEGTSAAEGGMKAGDVMLMWNEVELDSMGTLVEQLRAHKPGDIVTITVRRGGTQKLLTVKLKASGESE